MENTDDYAPIRLTKQEVMCIPNESNYSAAVDLLILYMRKIEHITTDELSVRTGINVRYITDMKTVKLRKRRFEIRNVIAVAIGLKMTPIHAMEYVEDCGYHLREYIEEEYFYILILHRCGQTTVKACNALLVDYGFEPLTEL